MFLEDANYVDVEESRAFWTWLGDRLMVSAAGFLVDGSVFEMFGTSRTAFVLQIFDPTGRHVTENGIGFKVGYKEHELRGRENIALVEMFNKMLEQIEKQGFFSRESILAFMSVDAE